MLVYDTAESEMKDSFNFLTDCVKSKRELLIYRLSEISQAVVNLTKRSQLLIRFIVHYDISPLNQY